MRIGWLILLHNWSFVSHSVPASHLVIKIWRTSFLRGFKSTLKQVCNPSPIQNKVSDWVPKIFQIGSTFMEMLVTVTWAIKVGKKCERLTLQEILDFMAKRKYKEIFSHIIGTLFRVTLKNILCGDWQLYLVLRTQFSRWHGGPHCSIFLWARVLFLSVFWPVFFGACFSLHVRGPSRYWMYTICCTAVRGIFAWFFACDAQLFTRVYSSKRACMLLTYDILPNRGLHLWGLPISIASRCGIQNLSHNCGNNARVAPRSEESL